jgi:two-component system CheB/CheR fusion protein
VHQFPPPPRQKSEREMNGYQSGDEFLIVVTHELRTPTAAILGWVELLDRTAIDSKMLAHGIEIIKRNAQLQSQLIDHLIDFSRISTDDFKLELEKIAIVPIVSAAIETMRPLALAKDIQITSRLDPVRGFIMGDSFRLQQVFTNLLSNAIKFTASGGHIRVLLKDDARSVEVKVSDTGKGISADVLPDIFNGFRHVTIRRATESGGLGLGLNISRRLIERHGGRIEAFSSGEGLGATFTVELPYADVGTS